MADKHVSLMRAAKGTFIGGAVFLIPAFLIFWVLAKVLGALRSLAVAVGPRIGIETALGGALLEAAAIGASLVLCLLGGVLARRATAQRMRARLDHLLLSSFPGYAFFKV